MPGILVVEDDENLNREMCIRDRSDPGVVFKSFSAS